MSIWSKIKSHINITGYPDRLCKSQKSRHVVLSRARRQAGLSSRLLKWVPTIHCVDIDRRDILLSREQTKYESIGLLSRSLIDTLITGIFQSFMYKLNMLCQSSSRFVAFTTNNQSPWTWPRYGHFHNFFCLLSMAPLAFSRIKLDKFPRKFVFWWKFSFRITFTF